MSSNNHSSTNYLDVAEGGGPELPMGKHFCSSLIIKKKIRYCIICFLWVQLESQSYTNLRFNFLATTRTRVRTQSSHLWSFFFCIIISSSSQYMLITLNVSCLTLLPTKREQRKLGQSWEPRTELIAAVSQHQWHQKTGTSFPRLILVEWYIDLWNSFLPCCVITGLLAQTPFHLWKLFFVWLET